ncbi:helix-turn-helix transcriptional regulator [Streptomyces xinghaiensis]|uniref:helix-turn-helix domain-containing protein n=1 Tax=Streptomyces xinghaiensis TaxID=1038928 RepID=UPI002E0D72D2|nr:helix-turn-helix transcriptional regulator [Streptomyces xinghaiensis]
MGNAYGDWLRAQREAAGMTQQELADAAIMTRSHISHIEAGRRIPSKDDARRLDKALNTGNVLSNFLPQTEMAVADYFEPARLLEQQATIIREFALSYIPGILQTEAYARAVLTSGFPPWSDEECDRHVVTRLERAKVLTDPVKPAVWALLDEAVLRRPIGGPAVMADQITHMARLAESGRVRIHILPLDLGAHPLLLGMLSLMDFEDQPPVAYSEAVSVGRLHDSPSVVDRLRNAYALAMGEALPQRESLTLMRAIAKEFGHHD